MFLITSDQEEYTENTGSLKMIIYNYPEETRALYDLMNKRHRERGEATSLSHIYNALKEVLWTSFEERNLDIIYNYLFLISVKEDLLSNLKSNASFEKNDFKKKYYEEIGSLIYNYSRDIVRENSIRSESNPTPTPRIRK